MFRIILFGIVFYYLFKFLGKLFRGFLFKKAQEQYAGYNKSSYQQSQRNEGDIKITYKPKDDKTHVTGGDYVDFEEVD